MLLGRSNEGKVQHVAGVVLATGIVEVIPSLLGSQKRITSELGAIDTTPVGASIGNKMGGGIAGSLKRVVGGALVALGGMKLGGLTKDAVSSFSELEDSSAAAGVVFGDSMSSIIKQSQGASKELGLSSQQVISAANTYGTYGKSAGLAGDDLAKFSTDFTGLAADMASFKGTSPEQAIEAIGAALRGETEPIRAYGVMLDDASMRQKALELGIVSTTKDALTPQQKILAAQALIFEQTADAQGDYARTSQSTANIAKTLSAETENLSAKFGQVLAPAFTAARLRAIGLVAGVSSLLDRVLAFQAALGEGALTPDLVRALGMDPEQGFGYAVGEGIGGLRAFSAAWAANDGDITSSGFPGFMEKTAYQGRQLVGSLGALWDVLARGDFTSPIFGQEEDSAFAAQLFSIREAAQGLIGGDFSAVAPLFDAILAVAKPAGPIFVEVGGAIGGLSKEIGQLVAGALPLAIPLLQGAANVMQYLADHTGVLTAVIIAGAAGWMLYKGAQAIANVAQLAAVPAAFANAAANLSLASAIRANTAASGAQLVVQQQTTGGVVKAGIAAAGAAIGHTALAVSQGVAAGATRALGFAVKALPFVGLLAILASVVAAGILFFTETETGRQIVSNAWAGIQLAVGGVVTWFQSTVVPIAQTVFAAIGTAASWLYTNAILPAFTGVQAAAGWIVGAFQNVLAFAAPIFAGIGTVLGGFGLLARGIFQVIVSVINNILIPAFVYFWTGVISPVFDWIGAKISSWWGFASTVFGIAVGFIRGTLTAGFTWLRDGVIGPVFDWIGNRIDAGVQFWTGVFQRGADFVRTVFGPAFTWLRDSIITPVWDAVGGKISGVYNDRIKPIFDFFADKIENVLPKAFQIGKDAIGRTWDGLKDIAKAPVKFVVETVLNNGLIAGFNKIADILPDVDRLPPIALPAGFARGGILPGYNSAKRDDVLTPMRSGEGVLVPEAVRALGPDTIHALNRAGNTGGTSAVRTMLAGDDAHYLGAPMPGSEPFIWGPPQRAAEAANRMNYIPTAGYPAGLVERAASVWNGIAGVELGLAGAGGTGGANNIAVAYGGMISTALGNSIGYYQGQSIIMDRGFGDQLAVLVHEMGHSLGIHHNVGNHSVMHPQLGMGGSKYNPTSYDAANLLRIYGPPGADAVRTTIEGDGGGGFDPLGFMLDGLTKLLDTLIGKLKDEIGSGIFTDVAIGVGRKIWGTAVDWLKDMLPGGEGVVAGPAGVATVYDGGGWLHNTGGAQLVQHNKRKPDAVLSSEQWSDISKLAAERSAPGDGDKVEMNVYPQPGQSEEQIATSAARKINRKRGRR